MPLFAILLFLFFLCILSCKTYIFCANTKTIALCTVLLARHAHFILLSAGQIRNNVNWCSAVGINVLSCGGEGGKKRRPTTHPLVQCALIHLWPACCKPIYGCSLESAADKSWRPFIGALLGLARLQQHADRWSMAAWPSWLLWHMLLEDTRGSPEERKEKKKSNSDFNRNKWSSFSFLPLPRFAVKGSLPATDAAVVFVPGARAAGPKEQEAPLWKPHTWSPQSIGSSAARRRLSGSASRPSICCCEGDAWPPAGRPALQHRSEPIWGCSRVSESGRSQEICDLWRYRKPTPTSPAPILPLQVQLSHEPRKRYLEVEEKVANKVRSAISTDRCSKLSLRGETSRPIDRDETSATRSSIGSKKRDVRRGEDSGEILYSLRAVQRQQQVFYFPLTRLFAAVNFIFSEEEVRWRRIVEGPSALNTVRVWELGMFQPKSVLFHRNPMRGCVEGERHWCSWKKYPCRLNTLVFLYILIYFI